MKATNLKFMSHQRVSGFLQSNEELDYKNTESKNKG